MTEAKTTNPKLKGVHFQEVIGSVDKDLRVRVYHSTQPREIASGQVIRNRGLSAVGRLVDEIGCGRVLSGVLPRSDRVKQESLRGALEKLPLSA